MSEILTVRVTPELKTALSERAGDEDRTLSNFARRVLHQAVATNPANPTGAEGGEQ